MTSLQVWVHVSGKLGTEQPLSSVPKLPFQTHLLSLQILMELLHLGQHAHCVVALGMLQ